MRHWQSCLRSLVGVAYFLGSCQLLFAASGLISVKCVDQENQALKGARVYVQCLNNNKTHDAKTNSEGLARFDKLNAGIYRVWTRIDGFAPCYFEFVRLKDPDQESVELSLKRGDPTEKLYFEDSEVLAKSEEYARQGTELLNQGRTAEAEEELERSLEINRSNPLVYHNLAVIYGRMNRWDESETSLRKELETLSAFMELQSGENAPLERLYQSASQLLDSLPVRRAVSQANAAMESEDYEATVTALKEAVGIDPSNAQLHFSMAVAYGKLGRVGEAKAALRDAISLNPENKSYKTFGEQLTEFESQMAAKKAASALAEIQQLNNESQYEKALERWDDSRDLIIDSDASAFWEEKSRAYLGLKQYGLGFEALQKEWELESKPQDQGFYALGQDFTRKGNQEGARKAFEKLLEVNPQFAEGYYELGMGLFYDAKDRSRARDLLQKYLTLGKDEAHLDNAGNVLTVIEQGQ